MTIGNLLSPLEASRGDSTDKQYFSIRDGVFYKVHSNVIPFDRSTGYPKTFDQIHPFDSLYGQFVFLVVSYPLVVTRSCSNCRLSWISLYSPSSVK